MVNANATFREAFAGKHDRLVEKTNSAVYSGLVTKLQAKGVITYEHKRHLEMMMNQCCWLLYWHVVDILTR